MISEEMYEVMMHMIGYGSLESNFMDAVHSCDHEELRELALQCNERWGDSSINMVLLEKNIKLAGDENE